MRSRRPRATSAPLTRPALAATLVLAASVAAPAVAAPEARAAGTCTANPMGVATPVGSGTGYTIFTFEDALFANQEIEGSIAVGGTAFFGDDGGGAHGQYPVQHQVAGNGDYALPTIDGAPNRVLLHRYAPGTRAVVVQVKDRGATHPGQRGGVKIADLSAPADYVLGKAFDSAGTTFSPRDGTNRSAQLSSHVQAWDGGAGAATFVLAKGSFDAYFGADDGARLLAQEGTWHAPLDLPRGQDVTITLDPTGPNRIALSDLAPGVMKLALSGHSATSPLVVTVAPQDVVGGTLTLPSVREAGRDGDMASYVLFDLSALTGTVTVVTPNEPIRGAIYAPDVHVVVPKDGGKELEGQVVAREFTNLADREIHTNLFQGVLPCVGEGPVEPVEPTEPTDPAVPVEPTEPAEPTEPVEQTDPTEPVEPPVVEVPEDVTDVDAPAAGDEEPQAEDEGAEVLAETGSGLLVLVALSVALTLAGVRLATVRRS